MESSIWIRESIKEVARVRDSYEDRSNMYRMDRNERTWKIPSAIIAQIRDGINSDTLTNYTEIDNTYYHLAKYLGVKYEQIYLHSGSDLVIKSVFETYIDKGDVVLMQNPCYAMYGVYAKMYGASICQQDFNDDLLFDLDEYCETIKIIHPKLVIVENPGGYIGNGFMRDDIERLIKTAQDCGSLVLVDEAYIDFIAEESVIDFINLFNNLIIVRTFSKAWGMAGLRAGYAVSNPLLISELFKVRPMHELTSFTAMTVEVMLAHADSITSYINEVTEVREFFCAELIKLGIRYAESSTHFVTACLGEKITVDDFRKRAYDNRFYVRRSFGQPKLHDWVRIGLLPMNEMQLFVNFLKDYINNNNDNTTIQR